MLAVSPTLGRSLSSRAAITFHVSKTLRLLHSFRFEKTTRVTDLLCFSQLRASKATNILIYFVSKSPRECNIMITQWLLSVKSANEVRLFPGLWQQNYSISKWTEFLRNFNLYLFLHLKSHFRLLSSPFNYPLTFMLLLSISAQNKHFSPTFSSILYLIFSVSTPFP